MRDRAASVLARGEDGEGLPIWRVSRARVRAAEPLNEVDPPHPPPMRVQAEFGMRQWAWTFRPSAYRSPGPRVSNRSSQGLALCMRLHSTPASVALLADRRASANAVKVERPGPPGSVPTRVIRTAFTACCVTSLRGLTGVIQ